MSNELIGDEPARSTSNYAAGNLVALVYHLILNVPEGSDLTQIQAGMAISAEGLVQQLSESDQETLLRITNSLLSSIQSQ